MSGAASALGLVARQELLLAARSRWLHVFAAAFALLALGLAASGRSLPGGEALQLARTSVSLAQLVVLVVPLVALAMGALELVPERGSAEMLFAQPVSRAAVLLGRYLGLLGALGAAELIGFGAAGLALFRHSGAVTPGGYALLVAGTVLLTADFLALAALLAAGGSARARTLTLALVSWMVFVVLLDLAALAAASALPSADASRVLVASVLVNPAAAFRTATLLAIEGASVFGAGSLALLRFTGGPLRAGLLLALSLGAWLVVPLALATRRIGRIDF